MPNIAQENIGSPLKRRLSNAARMTAQQESRRVQASRRRSDERRPKREAPADDGGRPRRRSSEKKSTPIRSWVFGSGKRVVIITLCLVIAVLVILYPAAQSYYQTMRHEQLLQAQFDAVTARNDAVAAENEALQTQEGIEAQAREDLGWVKEGEEGAIVTNEQGTTDNTSKLPEQVDKSKIRAPQTWYYAILDTIFFVHE